MAKEDCKYWDKCYQKNEQHLSKYNHPKKEKLEKKKNETDAEEKAQTSTSEAKIAAREAVQKRKMQDRSAEISAGTNGETEGTATEGKEIDTTELRTEALGNIAGKNYMEILQKRIKLAVQSEYDELLRSNEFIRHKFLVEMPPDFYAFWKFVSELKKDCKGAQILEHLDKQFKLQLVGPFEFLAGCFHSATIREPGDYLRHWRFFYDPPEFQTIFVRRGTGVHYGYWRDTPQDKDGLLIARNDASKGCEFEFVAGNAFDAFLYFLDKDFAGTPFTAAAVAGTKKALQKFIGDNEVHVDKLDQLQKSRNAKVVTKTFHRAGIVVPFETKTQLGYRPLIVSDAELKKIIQLFVAAGADDKDDSVKTAVMEKLQPVATAANIAVDECDFGTALELGIDLFCSGRLELHMLVQSLLVPAYTLLNRPQFIAISKAHLEKRSKELNLSIFELDKN